MAMLAYVFWHTKRDDVETPAYESALREFHRMLAANPPAGFVRSAAFHILHAPWLPDARGGYEDWYVVEDSAALDRLNEGAVSGDLTTPHDASARLAAWGSAGLYRSRTDELEALTAHSAVWFGKPSGISYASLLTKLEANEPHIETRLWQRTMTLGPTPEFCLLGRGSDVLPYGWEGALIVRRDIGAAT